MATGAVVGTTDIQTLTNKRIDGSKNTLTNVPLSALPAPISVDYRNNAVTYNTNSAWTPMSALVAVLDSPGLITNNGGGVTIIVPGRYEVQATAYFNVASAPRGVGVSKNSTTLCDSIEQSTMPGNTNVPITLSSPSVVYDCVAGDILRGMIYQQNVGINTWLANSLAFRAKRIG